MDTPPRIRNADPNDLETLVNTLSDGFALDPMFNWVFPKTQLYPYFFHLLVRDVYLPRGIVHVEERGRAAALWLPPQERYKVAPRMGLLKFGVKLVMEDGLRPVWRVHQQGAIFAKHHPLEPHYYLQFLGCRQSEQGQGIGTALLQRGIDVCDDHGMPAYLESSNIRNVPLYRRHGFEVKGEQAIGRKGPTAWFMWREPR